MVLMPLSVSASMTRWKPSVSARSASAALASAVEAAVSNMVPSGAVAFSQSEFRTVCGVPAKVNMRPADFGGTFKQFIDLAPPGPGGWIGFRIGVQFHSRRECTMSRPALPPSPFGLRRTSRIVLSFACAVCLVWLATSVSGQGGQPSTARGEWPHYTADLKGSRYSPLDQINASNFGKLEIAWRFKTDNFGPFPEFKLEGTPLMVNGVLYTTAGTRRSVIALDARTGELIWSHSMREGKRAAVSPRQLSGRGVSYWTDGKGDERVLYVTTGYRLVALNAKTGAVINSFGTNGAVDLKVGVVKGQEQQIDLETGEIGIHATPTIARDMVIIGASMREGATVSTHNNTKGLVRAFDVRTGKRVWQFNTIPRPGDFGSESWKEESWAFNG